MEPNVNHSICSKCGGKCCKYSGCALFPINISNPFRYSKLLKRMQTGKYSFKLSLFQDCESSQYGYQLRIKARNVDRDVVDLFSAPNRCMHWRAKGGCLFTDATRPYEGLHLIPQPSYQCYPDFSANFAFEQWEKVQSDLKKAFVKFSPNGDDVLTTLYKQYKANIEEVRQSAKDDPALKHFLIAVEALLKQEGYLLEN